MKKILLITVTIMFLISCSNSKKTAEDTNEMKPIAELPLAPGYIQASLEIIEIEAEESQQIVSAKVLEVLKYGSTTKPVPTDTIIKFVMRDDASEKMKNRIKPDATINAVLAQQESPKMSGNQQMSNYWKLISINN